MKHLITFITILFICIGTASAQSPAPIDSSKKAVQQAPETMPEYPRGLQAFMSYIGSNYVFPKEALEAKVSGRMIASFVIEKDGSLVDIKIIRDLGYGTGDELKRILGNSPKWKPGIQNGKPVRVQYTLPVMLSAPKEEPAAQGAGGQG